LLFRGGIGCGAIPSGAAEAFGPVLVLLATKLRAAWLFEIKIDRRDPVTSIVRRQKSQLLDVGNFDRYLININREEPTQR